MRFKDGKKTKTYEQVFASVTLKISFERFETTVQHFA